MASPTSLTYSARMATFPCPHCGEPVPAKALACPHCGSDEQTGWSDDTYLDGVDLPDEDTTIAERPGRNGLLVAIGLLLVLAMILMLVRS